VRETPPTIRRRYDRRKYEYMDNEKPFPILFYGAIVIAVAALLAGGYYLIPNINHVFIPAWAEPTKVHYKYVGLCGGIAALSVIGAVAARPKVGAK
jgi:hypothetical protein